MTALLSLVLALASTPVATNFYLADSDVGSPFATSAAERRAQLSAHLASVDAGDLILVGEAAGWRGARQSGVAFTSPTTLGLPGTREPSATTVHRALYAHGLQHRALLWNAFPLHPHEPGDSMTNRTPTAAELRVGVPLLRAAVKGRRIICVGGKSAAGVGAILGIAVPTPDAMIPSSIAVTVRHPAFGGAPQFRAGIDHAVATWRL